MARTVQGERRAKVARVADAESETRSQRIASPTTQTPLSEIALMIIVGKKSMPQYLSCGCMSANMRPLTP